MKKILSILLITLLPAQGKAQAAGNTYIDRDQVALAVTILLVAFVLIFLLELIKRYLDHRLKEKVLESGASEQLAALLLQRDGQDLLRACIKWLAVFLGLACGFAIIAIGGLSVSAGLAVIAFCLSGSFLSYYIFLKRPVR